MDIELNPGPKERRDTLFVCQWNLNIFWVGSFLKVDQLIAFLNVHKFDIVSLSEAFLDFSISDDDPRLIIDGFLFISVSIHLILVGVECVFII